jgi:hypothetical protein
MPSSPTLIGLLKSCVLLFFMIMMSNVRAEYYVVGYSYADGRDAYHKKVLHRASFKDESYHSDHQSSTVQRKQYRTSSTGTYSVTTYRVQLDPPVCPADEWSQESNCNNWSPNYWQGATYISPAEQRFLKGTLDVMPNDSGFDYDQKTADDVAADMNIDY